MNWNTAFAGHLKKLGLDQQEALFAMRKARIKATASQISYWSRGASYPRDETRAKIARWSKGDVPADLPPASAESGTNVAESAVRAS